MVDALEPAAAKYAADWPNWGHRKIHWMMRADGHTVSASSVERALPRRDLLQPINYQGERRELAKARKAAFAALFIASRPELLHIRTRTKSPGQNRERAFGPLKYEHLYRLEIEDLAMLAHEAEHYRHIFNHIRPHEALAGHRPIEVYRDPSLHPQLSIDRDS